MSDFLHLRPTALLPERSAAFPEGNRALAEAMRHPDMRGPADKAGVIVRASVPDAFHKFLGEQLAAFGAAIRQAKVPIEN